MASTRVKIAGLAAAGLLLFGACSDDDEETTTDETTTTTAADSGASGSEGTMAEEEMDIVETAVAAGDFTTLAALLEQAGLVETLQGDGPFTVFAPTDAAFEALDPATLEAVQNDPELLKSVLLYHVVEGEVMSSDIEPGDVPTVEGSTVTITVDGGTVKVNDATVTTADVTASNGVIHVIDTVLVPPAE
jgi:uncharacterized surface protein with fasciclin (FAS1) repeats